MAFQQQIDARVSFERLRHLRREGLLRVAIIDGIRFSFQAVKEITNQDVRAIGGNRRKGRDAGEQQDPIGSRVSAGLCLGNGHCRMWTRGAAIALPFLKAHKAQNVSSANIQ